MSETKEGVFSSQLIRVLNKFKIAYSGYYGFQTIVNFIYRSGDSPIRSIARLGVERAIPPIPLASRLCCRKQRHPSCDEWSRQALDISIAAVFGTHGNSTENTELTEVRVSHYMHEGKRMETTKRVCTRVTEKDSKRIIQRKFAV